MIDKIEGKLTLLHNMSTTIGPQQREAPAALRKGGFNSAKNLTATARFLSGRRPIARRFSASACGHIMMTHGLFNELGSLAGPLRAVDGIDVCTIATDSKIDEI